MNSVKCLLMGSAAGLMVVSAAQAADLPVKAAPVEYVKVCNIYGAGFWYVPGTDTCMKIGTWVRAQFSYGGAGGGTPLGWQGAQAQNAGFMNRVSTSYANSQFRGLVTIDARTQTEYGTLRSYIDAGAQWSGWATWPNSPLSGGNTTGAENAINTQYVNNNIDNTRAFIQFAGFTAGKMRSMYDIVAPGAYAYSTLRTVADSADGGTFGIGYTAQFSGGLSLSLALEDPGVVSGTRQRGVANLSRVYWGGGPCVSINPVNNSCVGGGGISPNTGQNLDNAGAQFWNPVLNLRIDQSWGFAAISGALQDNDGAYYNNAINSSNSSMANTLVQGHPGDVFGYAGSVGFTLTDFLGNKGDTFTAQVNAGHGATSYVWRVFGTFFQRSGNNVAFGNNIDGVYANGTPISQSDEFSAFMGYEHFWTPKLHTSWFGGGAAVSWGQSAKNLMCAGAPGFGIPNNALGFAVNTAVGAPSGFINGWSPGSQCNPNWGLWQAGTRTVWNPHPDLDIGVDIMYSAIRTANRGATVWNGVGATGVAPGLYTFANEGQWTASFRVQRNFLP